MDFIVLASLAFVIAFLAAWALSPALRAWLERPKHRFQANVKNYDQERRRES